MTMQFSSTVRSGWIARFESDIGTSPKLRLVTGAQPANCAASQSGTQLIEMTLPSDWLTESGGVGSKSGTWSGTVSSSGTAGYYRLLSSGGTCHHQGLVTQAFKLTTNATTSAGINILNFASTTGVTAGMSVAGTGVPTGATVLSVTSTTVTISLPSTAGVAGSVDIYFGDTSGNMWLNSTALTATSTLTIDAWTITAPGA